MWTPHATHTHDFMSGAGFLSALLGKKPLQTGVWNKEVKISICTCCVLFLKRVLYLRYCSHQIALEQLGFHVSVP